MDAGDIVFPGQLRDRRGVLHGAHEGVVVADGQHDVRKAGGDDAGDVSRRAVALRQAVGRVQRGALVRRDIRQQLRRRHVHPHGIAPDGDGQLAGLRMGGAVAVGHAAQLPQQREGGHRRVAAQLHLSGGGEITQGHGAVRLTGDKGGFGMLELRGDLPHDRIGQGAVGQDDARLIAAEYPRGKRIHDIGFHGDDLLSFFHGIYYIVSCP